MRKHLLLIFLAMTPMVHAATATYDGTVDVTSRERWGAQPSLPPLDTSYLWSRKNGDGAGTHELMSLIMEQDATTSYTYPWLFYSQLTLNNDFGQGVDIYSRLYNNGDSWGVGIHSEGISSSSGDTIGSNVEMSPVTGSTGRVIAYNAQARDGYNTDHPNKWSEVAYNIQSDLANGNDVGFTSGVKIDNSAKVTNGFHIKSTADVTYGFLNESANTDVALATGPAPIALRTQAYSKVCLDTSATICFYYDSANGRIQFKSGTHFIGYIDAGNWNNNCLNCGL